MISYIKLHNNENCLLSVLFTFPKEAKMSKTKKNDWVTPSCGHQCKRFGKVIAFGQTRENEVKISQLHGRLDLCHGCVEKLVICCAACGRMILVYDSVRLLSPNNENYSPPKGVIWCPQESDKLIGCYYEDCVPGGLGGILMPDTYNKEHGVRVDMTIFGM